MTWFAVVCCSPHSGLGLWRYGDNRLTISDNSELARLKPPAYNNKRRFGHPTATPHTTGWRDVAVTFSQRDAGKTTYLAKRRHSGWPSISLPGTLPIINCWRHFPTCVARFVCGTRDGSARLLWLRGQAGPASPGRTTRGTTSSAFSDCARKLPHYHTLACTCSACTLHCSPCARLPFCRAVRAALPHYVCLLPHLRCYLCYAAYNSMPLPRYYRRHC